MKKKYEKPMIIIENFSFSNTIAADCEVVIDGQSRGTCGYKDESERFPQVIFVESQVCSTTQPEGYNGICYHTFEANSIFNS